MYVVIRGRAEVLAGDPSRPVPVGLVERGHVAGEMGLLRHRPRTADVRALEDTEVLVVNDRFLDVLRRRYPRIAATVLLNLTRIVSDRLEATTAMAVASREGAADLAGSVRGAPR
jgi:CRP-like cAMP-binding protein